MPVRYILIFMINDFITDTAHCDLHMQYACSRANIILHGQPPGNINTTRINVSHVKCDRWSKTAWYGSLPIITWLQYISETYPTCGIYVQGFCFCCWFIFVFRFLCSHVLCIILVNGILHMLIKQKMYCGSISYWPSNYPMTVLKVQLLHVKYTFAYRVMVLIRPLDVLEPA